MKVKPQGKRIFLEQIKEENKTGLILPEDRRTELTLFKAFSTGPKCEFVQKGDKVLLDDGQFKAINMGDTKLILVDEDDIIGIVYG